MANRTQVSAEQTRQAEWNQKKIERFRGDPAKALEHSRSRNERVGEVLCYLSLLRSTATVKLGAAVRCEKAVRQHFSSCEGYQAAHYLPGQIYLDGVLPWTFVRNVRIRRKFEGLFGDVEHLPANLNKADSAAEQHGLKDAFRMACQQVVRDPQPKPNSRINREWVRQAYQNIWRPCAERAFRAATAQKDTKPHLPSLQKDEYGNILNLRAREAASQAQWNIEEQMRILEYYVQSLNSLLPPSLLDYRMNELEGAFQP